MHTRRVMLIAGLALALTVFLAMAPLEARAAAKTKMVEVILDCSGSMKGRLPSGETRIAAAKQAVET
ncbi:MAG: alpha-1-antitrypsin, partial [Desulfarculus sp.]|nr:alpha-1-antitrypsin [Desulfarculus sp.]